MFSPDMLKAAQGMMANMSPEDMQRMTQMAANMDPSVMENMMKNMGGAAPGMTGMDSGQMKEQMKRIGQMSPDEIKSSMSQAQQQMGGQKQYMYNASMQLKNEGNDHIKAQKYSDALRAYSKALENLKPFSGDDIAQLRLSLLLNSAMCHLKENDPARTVEVCEEALQINSHSVKALFRRGLARVDLGQLAEGVADMKFAAKLSPDDKTIASELQRVEKDCLGKGVSSDAIDAAQQKAEEAASKSSSSSPSPSWPPASGGQNVEQAMEQISKNPEMVNQATEMMKNMSPEDIERMMSSAPLPPGVDKETARKRMEAVSKNPEMLKTAMDALSSMPEEERKRMLSAASGSGAAPDFSKMGDMMKDPAAMKSAMAAASAMGHGSGPEADLMKKMTENPEMMDAMTNMMKNIPPDQMQKMMDMSMKMKSGGADGADPSQMLNDPDMMKAAEEMMKNMSPEALQSMAKSAGMEVSESQAKMISRVMPFMMKGLKLWGYVKKMFSAMFSPRGRIILAVVIVLVAVGQHYYFSEK